MNQLQGQAGGLWSGLTSRQKLTIVVVAAAVVGGLYLGVQWNRERDLRPLFVNLAADDAGAVVERLKTRNIEYRIGEGGVILVPSAQAAELRLEMAAVGLPRTGRIGFELFDKVNLGTTEFAEQVNYRRALEGELERSIMALSEVERARVHVTPAKDSVFLDSRQPAKASVLVQLRPGMKLSPQNVSAITHLTASAVESLAPEFVSLVDMQGNLLNRPHAAPEEDGETSGAMIEYRQSLEKETLAKIRATLDPLLGPEKYRAGVSLECDFTSGEQSEETFDPDKSVMVSSQKSEDANGLAAQSGVPGTASNLPRPAARSTSSGGGTSRKTESIAYQTSRVVKKTKIPQGSVRRLSVSVLVDQQVSWQGVGSKAQRLLQPPPAEKLKVVRDVLAGVVGFRQERGDQILVESLPFEATLALQPPPEPVVAPPPATSPSPISGWFKPLYQKAPPMVWAAAAACVGVVFIVGLIFFARVLFRRHKNRAKPQPAAIAASAADGSGATPHAQAAADIEARALAQLAENASFRDRQELEALVALKLPPHTKKSEVLKKYISDEAKKDPTAIAHLVRSWLNEQSR